MGQLLLNRVEHLLKLAAMVCLHDASVRCLCLRDGLQAEGYAQNLSVHNAVSCKAGRDVIALQLLLPRQLVIDH